MNYVATAVIRRMLWPLLLSAQSITAVAVNTYLRPLCPGLMYNDGMKTEQAGHLNNMGRGKIARLGYRFNSSFSLTKPLWLLENEPPLFKRSACILNQADFITTRPTGISFRLAKVKIDESKALKVEYGILERRWQEYISKAGIELSKLPTVAAIGETIGHVGLQAVPDYISPAFAIN